MNFQKLQGGMIAGFAMTGLVAALGLGSGLAAVADMGDDKTPTPKSEVQTAENCVWYMTGTPTSLDLKPADSDAIYDGSALAISTGTTLSNISIYMSGNEGSQTNPTACTFYAGTVAPKLTWSIAELEPEFTATDAKDNEDADFNFDFDLDFVLSPSSCNKAFDVTDVVNLSKTNNSVVGIEIDNVNKVTTAGQSCSTSVKAETTIPAIQEVPASAGALYTWTGPTVTITGSTHN